MIRPVLLLLLTLGLFAGLIAWLHHRAGPSARPKSPAELALERKVVEFSVRDRKNQDLLIDLERQTGLPIANRLLLEQALDHRFPHLRWYLNWRGLTVAQILDLLLLRVQPHELGYDCDGRGIRIDRVRAIPHVWRVYDLADVIKLIVEAKTGAGMDGSSSAQVESSVVWSFVQIEADLTQAKFCLAGNELAAYLTPRSHRHLDRFLEQMRHATTTTPPAQLTAVLDSYAPPIPDGELTLEQHLAAVLPRNLNYRVNWHALAEVGVTPGMRSTTNRLGPLSRHLDAILEHAATQDSTIQAGGLPAKIAIGYFFDGATLIIDRRENCAPRMQRYLSSASDRDTVYLYQFYASAFSERQFSRYLAYVPFDNGFVVIADEDMHARIRWLVGQRRE